MAKKQEPCEFEGCVDEKIPGIPYWSTEKRCHVYKRKPCPLCAERKRADEAEAKYYDLYYEFIMPKEGIGKPPTRDELQASLAAKTEECEHFRNGIYNLNTYITDKEVKKWVFPQVRCDAMERKLGMVIDDAAKR